MEDRDEAKDKLKSLLSDEESDEEGDNIFKTRPFEVIKLEDVYPEDEIDPETISTLNWDKQKKKKMKKTSY